MLEFPKNKDIINAGAVIFKAFEYDFIDIVEYDVAIKRGGNLGTVRLYIPAGLNENYAISYNNENVSVIAQSYEQSGGLKKGEQFVKNVFNKIIQEGQQKAGKPFIQIGGKALFPNTINIFQGTSNYNLSYSYNFIPRNKNEADEMMKIIDFFRRMSLPVDVADDDAFLKLKFPAVFDIIIRSNISNDTKISTKNNSLIIKEYHYMVLNNVSITYVPNGESWMSFNDGKPVSINLSLSFIGMTPPRIRRDRMTGQIL